MSGIDRDSDGNERRSSADLDPPPQAGVLGNLPRKRPAVRSPRRAAARPEAAEAPAAAAAEAETGAGEGGPAPRAASAEPPAGAEPEHSAAADLEGLARGGIAIAGGAASLGLRIAGRAAAALRDAVERR